MHNEPMTSKLNCEIDFALFFFVLFLTLTARAKQTTQIAMKQNKTTMIYSIRFAAEFHKKKEKEKEKFNLTFRKLFTSGNRHISYYVYSLHSQRI